MTPEAFKQMMKDKGWKATTLSARWGFKDTSSVYQIIRNGQRAEHWNDAIRGLPYIIENSEIIPKKS